MNCSQLYLGTYKQLPESESKHFSVKLGWMSLEERQQVQNILKTEYVYYLSPHTGCGCGWDFLDVGDEDNRQSCEALKTFLFSLAAERVPIKILSVCSESIGSVSPIEKPLPLHEFINHLIQYRVPYSSLEARLYYLSV